jgi:ribonuclease HI
MADFEGLHVTIHIDGGARGNPGPAAAGVVIRAADDGTILHEAGVFLGPATNNVAEYRGLLWGLEAAERLGATEIDCFSDSQLMVRQIRGEYRVKNAGLRPLYEQALSLMQGFDRVELEHVRREQNKEADRLVNLALNRKGNVEDAAV